MIYFKSDYHQASAEQELLKLLKHLSSLPGVSGVCVTRSFVFCVMFCWSLFILFPVCFLVLPLYCLSSIYGLWLFLWYLKTSLCSFFKQYLVLTSEDSVLHEFTCICCIIFMITILFYIHVCHVPFLFECNLT